MATLDALVFEAMNSRKHTKDGGSASFGAVSVRVVPVQPRGRSTKWGTSTRYYVAGAVVTREEASAALVGEG